MFIINLLRIQPQQIETTLSIPKCIVLRSQGLKTVHALGQRRHMKRKVFKLFCSMLQNISHYFLRVKNYLHSWREPHANVFSFSLVRVLWKILLFSSYLRVVCQVFCQSYSTDFFAIIFAIPVSYRLSSKMILKIASIFGTEKAQL